MSSLTGHLSLFATQSLKSIDKWMNTVQGNLTGSVRNAYKESTLTYGGGNVNILKETSDLQNGIQIGEQALNVGNTKLNWDNGEIVSSTQETHFAIQGDGFFMVQDPGTLNPAAFLDVTYNPNTGVTASGAGQVYLTRDGEFHFGMLKGSSVPVLMDSHGFIVLSDHGDLNQVLGTITRQGFDSAPVAPPGLSRIRPSIVVPSRENDQLQFSKYGSTYLQFEQGVPVTGTVIVDGSSGQLDAGGISLKEKALEGSNVKVESNIVELAALGKMYNGFVQVIKVYNSALDEVLGFIR